MKNKCSNCLMNEVCSEKVKELYNDAPCPYFKTEKKYRPFRDTDELIKVWCNKCPAHNHRERGLTMPLIWVRHKEVGSKSLITDFVDDVAVIVGTEGNGLQELFYKYTFLDGSPCGVEE